MDEQAREEILEEGAARLEAAILDAQQLSGTEGLSERVARNQSARTTGTIQPDPTCRHPFTVSGPRPSGRIMNPCSINR